MVALINRAGGSERLRYRGSGLHDCSISSWAAAVSSYAEDTARGISLFIKSNSVQLLFATYLRDL